MSPPGHLYNHEVHQNDTSKKHSKHLNTYQPHIPSGQNKLLEIWSTSFGDVDVVLEWFGYKANE